MEKNQKSREITEANVFNLSTSYTDIIPAHFIHQIQIDKQTETEKLI